MFTHFTTSATSILSPHGPNQKRHQQLIPLASAEGTSGASIGAGDRQLGLGLAVEGVGAQNLEAVELAAAVSALGSGNLLLLLKVTNAASGRLDPVKVSASGNIDERHT
jgi:hypothetical protein